MAFGTPILPHCGNYVVLFVPYRLPIPLVKRFPKGVPRVFRPAPLNNGICPGLVPVIGINFRHKAFLFIPVTAVGMLSDQTLNLRNHFLFR